MEPDSLLMLCRAVRDGAALFLFGSLVFAGWLAPAELGAVLCRRLARSWRIAAGLAALAVLTALPCEIACVGEGWRDCLSPDVALTMLSGTTIGTAWLAEATAACLCLSAILWSRRTAVAAIPAGALLTATALTGHVRMVGIDASFFQVAHVLAAGFWAGGLVPVSMLVSDFMHKKGGWPAQQALARYSTAGHIAVPIVLLSGSGLGLTIFGGYPAVMTAYSTLLLLKLALTLGMTAVACLNRYICVANLRKRRNVAVNLDNLQRGTIAEIAFAVLAVAAVAVAGRLDPVASMAVTATMAM